MQKKLILPSLPDEEEDVNIWDEPEHANILIDTKQGSEGALKAGSLNKLVGKLTSEESPGGLSSSCNPLFKFLFC